MYPYENANSDLKEHERTALQLQDKSSKQRYINARWDEIEHRLRNEDFWAFITNRSATNTRNRIEILFDLISQKYVKGRNPQAPTLNKDDSQYTYLYFDLLIKEKRTDLWNLWKRVQAYYSRLCFWFENNDYYHRIGYLIYLQHSGDKILTDLLTSAEGKKKGEFEEDLTARIKSTLPDQSKINELDYKKNVDDILKILLLHNIESCCCNEAAGRFPFALFKKKGMEKNWTIEHIHAQNSECLDANAKDTWLAWAKINEAVLRENQLFEERDKSLLDDLKNAISRLEAKDREFTHDKIVSLFDRVSNIYSTGPIPVLHQLSNLTLLDGSINSGIGNSVFEVKRQYISKCDADGDYIPYCTRRVFLKYYYDKGSQDINRLNQQTFTWGAEDRKNYLEDIKTKLSPYLSESSFTVKGV